MDNRLTKIIVLILVVLSATSCVVVRGYEKIYLNDPDMGLKARKSEKFVTAFQVYREGASGANGGKAGGGCGCN